MQYQSFSPRQRLALTWWRRSEFAGRDGLLCDGSVRSGKTLSMTAGFLLWSMSRFNGEKFALCGKTIEALRRNVTDGMPQWMEGIYDFQERRSENRITVTGGGRRNTYYLFGGKDESSYALIQGMTLAGVLLDEVALMPRSFVEQALARCSVAGSKFWFNCNPAGPEHWFYREWVQQAGARNLLYLHFTMEDNPALAPDIRARYERLYTGVFYDRYVRGLWVAAEGLVYDGFDPRRHVLSQLPETAGDCYVSVDYGTRNPTVFLLWQKDRAGRWVCLREYCWDGRQRQRQKTDGEYADDLLFFLAGCHPRTVIIDPSAASFITELQRRGLPVQAADNRVLDGIRNVSQLLREGKLLFSKECSRTISEFRAYVWDETAAAQGVDKPVKDHDHCMDAVRYFVSTVVSRGSARAGRRPKGM
ncbi:MAG: PBSX family phage terminase large subunit [Clostridiales bacterium]|nr:PBSX family phage terminase large subunit [Clostridiales bacterium]